MRKIIVLPIVLIFALLYHLFPRILVCGYSMYPTYEDNEIIWGTRLFKRKNLKVGDVVVAKFVSEENEGHTTIIKRISRLKEDKVYLLGDNPKESYDSRYYGYIPLKCVKVRLLEQRSKVK